MGARNKLNVKQVERIIKPGIYSDGGGLYLRVRNSGTRSWLYVCWLNGRRREMGLGSVQDVSLAKAREKAAAARSQYLDGIDPIAARKAVKVDKKPEVTFGAFAIELLDSIEDGFKNPKHRQQWRSTLTTYAAPMFELPIGEVKAEHVLEVLKPIWLSKAETASRLRGRIERILDAAKAQGLRDGDNPARGKGHLDLLLPKRSKTEVRHHAALSHNQVAAFMTELASRPAMAARALEFTVLTAARSGETRGMTWGEVDLENSLWTVPAERMKAGETHQVPLSASALAVLRSVKPDDVIADKLVFPAPRGGTMSDMSMAQLLKRMGRTDITVHGFRSTFRDWAGDTTNFGREEVEMSLAHTIQSATERAYRRGRALDKRRDLMDAWAKYCSRQI
ncbi:integrase [Sphingobium sp. B11D3A]|nr:integrase [Sphingobium sp. B11D3A]